MPPELELRRNEILNERDLLKSKVFDLEISWDKLFNPGGFCRRDSGARRRQGHDGVDSRTWRQQQGSGVSPDQSQCNSNLIGEISNITNSSSRSTWWTRCSSTPNSRTNAATIRPRPFASTTTGTWSRSTIPTIWTRSTESSPVKSCFRWIILTDFSFMSSHINTLRFTHVQFFR